MEYVVEGGQDQGGVCVCDNLRRAKCKEKNMEPCILNWFHVLELYTIKITFFSHLNTLDTDTFFVFLI